MRHLDAAITRPGVQTCRAISTIGATASNLHPIIAITSMLRSRNDLANYQSRVPETAK